MRQRSDYCPASRALAVKECTQLTAATQSAASQFELATNSGCLWAWSAAKQLDVARVGGHFTVRVPALIRWSGPCPVEKVGGSASAGCAGAR